MLQYDLLNITFKKLKNSKKILCKKVNKVKL